jgi:hypothetical protein
MIHVTQTKAMVVTYTTFLVNALKYLTTAMHIAFKNRIEAASAKINSNN